MNEETEEQKEIKGGIHVLLLNTNDARWPEWTVIDGTIIPREETKLEQVLHHYDGLQCNNRDNRSLGLAHNADPING